jgi:hypothetical protein
MVCWRGFDVPPLGFRERSGTKRAARAATPKQSLPQGSAHRNGSEGFPRAEMETRIEPMDRRSKNEGGNANCNTTADSARDTENPPYKLTVRDAETFVKYKAASETRGPRLKVQADGATAKFSVDHPDEAIGTVALMRAIGTTDLDFYDGDRPPRQCKQGAERALTERGKFHALGRQGHPAARPDRGHAGSPDGSRPHGLDDVRPPLSACREHPAAGPHRAASNSVFERPSVQANA